MLATLQAMNLKPSYHDDGDYYEDAEDDEENMDGDDYYSQEPTQRPQQDS